MRKKNLLIVTTEQHFYKLGTTMYVVGDEDIDFWQRYLQVFDEILVVGRVSNVEHESENAKISSGNSVTFAELPDFDGISGLVLNVIKLIGIISSKTSASQHVLLRVPGLLSYLTFLILYFKRRTWSLEVVADPKEEASNANSLISKLFSSRLAALTRYMCKKAKSVSYVTREVLQNRYPSGQSDNYSYSSLNISIDPKQFDERQDLIDEQPDELITPKLVLVGRMSKPFKGIDTALKMLAYAKEQRRILSLNLVGGGQLLEEYSKMAKELGVEDQCIFHGELRDKSKVLNILSRSDIMILPSRREGLPRAIIEAMSMGLPVVASNVAGIPELVPKELLIHPDDHVTLFKHVDKLSMSKKLRRDYSKYYFELSKYYDIKNLERVRTEFYRSILSM